MHILFERYFLFCLEESLKVLHHNRSVSEKICVASAELSNNDDRRVDCHVRISVLGEAHPEKLSSKCFQS